MSTSRKSLTSTKLLETRLYSDQIILFTVEVTVSDEHSMLQEMSYHEQPPKKQYDS